MNIVGKRQETKGFTIVELLIVIVVIAILASITIVSYNGITAQARAAKLQATLAQVRDQVLVYRLSGGHTGYPDSLADINIANQKDMAYQYTVDNTVSPRKFAVTISNGIAGNVNYYVTSSDATVREGIAPGHNIIAWDKTKDETAPITGGVTIDKTVFRTSTASVRLAPGATGRLLRSSPYVGQAGQTYTVDLWIKTDSNWNGGSGNSKIRFGVDGGGYQKVCAYNGVKTQWTRITCSSTMTAAYTYYNISVGNDGTAGNIWIDDVSVSIE